MHGSKLIMNKEVLSIAWAKLNKHENREIRAKLVKRLKDERPDIYTPFWHGAYTVNFSPDTHEKINASRNWLAAAFISRSQNSAIMGLRDIGASQNVTQRCRGME